MKNKKSTIEYVARTDDDTSVAPAALTISTIAALPTTTDLNDSTLFEISVENAPLTQHDSSTWTSRSVSWNTIFSKLQAISANYFNSQYIKVRYDSLKAEDIFEDAKPDDTTVREFIMSTGLVTRRTNENPVVWDDVYALAEAMVRLDGIVDALDLRVYAIEHSKIVYSATSQFLTSLYTFESGSGERREAQVDIPNSLSEAYEKDSSGIHRSFTLAFFNTKKVSSVYTCPKAGLLSLYGWLDTSNVADRLYLPDAWCALEAEINGKWEILQLVNVLPNRQFCYASFSVPVEQGLNVRLHLGFVPGNASGRYPHTDIPSSLGNHIANAFLGGVYAPRYAATSGAAAPRSETKAPITIERITQNITNPPVDTSKFATKEEVSNALPRNFYGRELLYTREQVERILDNFIQKDDIVPEVSQIEGSDQNDDKPVNRLAVWNFAKATEQPVGTVIAHIYKPKSREGIQHLINNPEWLFCNGEYVKTKDYPELAAVMGKSKEEQFALPDYKLEAPFKYVKARSSVDMLKDGGWSKNQLKSQGVKTEVVEKKSWKDDSKISGVFNPKTRKYNKSVTQTL